MYAKRHRDHREALKSSFRWPFRSGRSLPSVILSGLICAFVPNYLLSDDPYPLGWIAVGLVCLWAAIWLVGGVMSRAERERRENEQSLFR